MQTATRESFSRPDVGHWLTTLDAAALDGLDFGVIGFDRGTYVQVYNAFESAAAGLAPGSVLGKLLFAIVAPCMNNFMVAQPFADAMAANSVLDTEIDYVLTLRMRPTRVRLRLVSHPDLDLAYVLVRRSP